MGVNLSAVWTKDTKPDNGLEAIEAAMLEDPTRVWVVIGLVRPKFAKTDYESGTETPTVRLVAVEPLTDAKSATKARTLMEKAREARTGVAALPMDDDGVSF